MLTGHLFVYGTLMSRASDAMGSGERNRLRREARSLGPATLGGRLFDLGQYPGLILSEAAEDVVQGEVFQLLQPAVTVAWLDRYEGIGWKGRDRDDYQRVTREVALANNAELEVWTYVFQGSLRSARLIRSGCWRVRPWPLNSTPRYD